MQEVVHGVVTNYELKRRHGYLETDDGHEVYFNYHARGRPRPTTCIFNGMFVETLYLTLVMESFAQPEPGDRMCFTTELTPTGWRAPIWCFEKHWDEAMGVFRHTQYRVRYYMEDREPDGSWLVHDTRIIAQGMLDDIETKFPRRRSGDPLTPTESADTRIRFEFERMPLYADRWMAIDGDPRLSLHAMVQSR